MSITKKVIELTARHGQFNRAIATRTFRGYTSAELHNSVMSAARQLVLDGMLKSDGFNYTFTTKGRNMIKIID